MNRSKLRRRSGPSRGKDGPVDAFGVTDRDRGGGAVHSGATHPGSSGPAWRPCRRRLQPETGDRGAGGREFNIPKVHSSWEDLVEDDTIHAVVIGAWPYLHCPVTLAALDAGKHVLTAARMAMNAREAQRMYDRAREHPKQTAMVVPSPYGLAGDPYMRSLIAPASSGKLREVHVHGLSSGLADPRTPLNWRQVTKYLGFNMLTLGILYEIVLRWAPPASRVSAYAATADPEPPRSRVGQAHPRRHARQRAGADGPGRRLVRDLPHQRRGLAQHRHGNRALRERGDALLRPDP